MKAFFATHTKHHKELQVHIESIKQALWFLENYKDTPNDILTLAKYEDDWPEMINDWPYTKLWSMLTFYRCMEKLKKAQDYFDKPPANHSFSSEHNHNKDHYLPIIMKTLKLYDKHYEFSKLLWEVFNEACETNGIREKNTFDHNPFTL